jgi:hypothetical protein
MKNILFLLLVIPGYLSAQVITPDALRREYEQAFKDSAACSKLYKKLIRSANADNVTTAYRGAVTTAMANHVKTKKEKLELFNQGKKLLEQSIAADNSNAETRFLRLSVQVNAPKALNYNKQIASDKEFILKNYPTLTNTAVKRMISSFAQESKAFTEAEKQKLK